MIFTLAVHRTAETAAAAKRAGNGVRGPAIGYAGVEGVNAVAQRV
jgi:hypothetical protein